MSGLIALFFGFLQRKDIIIPKEADEKTIIAMSTFAVGYFGLLLSLIWFISIRYYYRVISRKYEVLKNLETNLDFHFFAEEWKLLNIDKVEGVLEFIETEKSVARSTKLIKFPEDVFPNCQCRSELRTDVRDYITGTEFWLYCSSCEASGYEGIPVYKLGQLPIPQSIMSDLLSKLERVENLQDRSDEY